MKLDVYNLTDRSLLCHWNSKSPQEHHILLPKQPTSIRTLNRSSMMTLTAHQSIGQRGEKDEIWLSTISFSFRRRRSALWTVMKVDESSPWMIYRCRVSRRRHKLLILPKRDPLSFLSRLSDSTPLSSLCLPGTHDSLALYGWPVAQCQSIRSSLSYQLRSGIRIIDVRLAVKEERLMVYHGLVPQKISFQQVLSDVYDFLTDPASCLETIVMSIKQEDFAITPPPGFSALVHKEIQRGPGGMGMWYLENRIPLLGEVRGKVIMFSRFGGDGAGWEGRLEGMGIHPARWPDSEKKGFEWFCKNTLVKTQDWYEIPSFLSIPEKVDLATKILVTPKNALAGPTLAISFFSAASFPLALPTTVARGFGWPGARFGVEGVNSRFGFWLLNALTGEIHGENATTASDHKVAGWTLMDFFEDPEDHGVIPLLIECNFRET